MPVGYAQTPESASDAPTAVAISSAALAGANPQAWQPTPFDWSSTAWTQSSLKTNSSTGEVTVDQLRYVELADGLNYLDSAGLWQRSADLIEVLSTPYGEAAAVRGPTKAYFPASLGGPDGVITLISASNTVIRIAPLAVYFVDDSTGESVLLASIRPGTVGELVGDHQVVYRQALEGDLAGDVRFTYLRGRCESDLVLTSKPAASPEAYGLSPEFVRLELVSSVASPMPKATRRFLPDGRADVALEYDSGALRFVDGYAFLASSSDIPDGRAVDPVLNSLYTAARDQISVAKEMVPVAESGRWGLGESLRWVDIAPKLQALPPLHEGGTSPRPQRHATYQRQWPKLELTKVWSNNGLQLAKSSYHPRGVVLDWALATSGDTYSFTKDQTYHISSFCSFRSRAGFSPGAVLKFSKDAALFLRGKVDCSGSAEDPTILTAFDDWDFGLRIPGSTGSPVYSADCAVWVRERASGQALNALRVRWARTGLCLEQGDDSGVVNVLSNSAFESCDRGIFCRNSSLTVLNSTRCEVRTPVAGEGAWGYTGALTDVCGITNNAPGSPGSYQLGTPQTHALAAVAGMTGVGNDPLAPSPLVGQGCTNSPPDLVAWWRGEGDGTDFIGGNDGKLCSGTGFTSGQVQQGFNLNPSGGSGQYVLVSSSPALKPTGEFTVELWYKDTGCKTYWVGLVGKLTPSYTGFYVHLLANSTLGVVVADPASGTHSLTVAAPSANTFHHLAATWRQSDLSHVEMRLFIDGVCQNTGTYSGKLTNIVSDTPLRIGTDLPSGDFFTGIIDEVSFYSRALTTNEISGIFNAGTAGKCLPTYAPAFSVQPTNQTVSAGSDVLLAALATGSSRLVYQWRLNGTNILGATNRIYITNNVQVGQGGNYSVLVTNAYGVATSSVASLSITSAPSCTAAPPGLVAWWKGEANAVDQTGGNRGALINGTTFVSGKSGQAFSFLGFPYGSAVNIASSPALKLTNELTYEFWFKAPLEGIPGTYGLLNKYPIPERCCCSSVGANFGALGAGDDYYMTLYLSDTNYGIQGLRYWPPPTPGMFHHMAVSYHQSTSANVLMTLFLDGKPVLTNSVLGNLANAQSDTPVTLGAWWPDGHAGFAGIIDEAAIYSRALSASEVASIYSAGSSGKCVTTNAPQIIAQPVTQTAALGDEVAFTVFASGSLDLAYQWLLNGSAISGATDSSYLMNTVQYASAGTYSVLITNLAGSVLSSNANLSLASPPTCVLPPSGLVSWWRAEADATDSVGTNNGSLLPGAGFSNGKVNMGFSFTGSNSVHIPSSPSLRLTNAFTVGFWYKDTGSASTHGLVAKAQSTSPYPANFAIWEIPNDVLIAGYFDRTLGYWSFVEVSPVPTSGLFHHVAAVYQQSDTSHVLIHMYVDGQCAATGTYPGNLANTLSDAAPVTIGSLGTNGNYFTGVIDEVTIFNRPLSAAEIQSIYASSGTGNCLTGDYDNDGLPDSWERLYFANLSQGPTGDPDGDGLSNLQEYLLSTNPTNNDLGLKVIITSPRNGSAFP